MLGHAQSVSHIKSHLMLSVLTVRMEIFRHFLTFFLMFQTQSLGHEIILTNANDLSFQRNSKNNVKLANLTLFIQNVFFFSPPYCSLQMPANVVELHVKEGLR